MPDNLSKVNVQNPQGVALNRLNTHAAAHKIIFSKDFLMNHTSQGTHIGIKPSLKCQWETMKYAGEWNASASFDLFSVCRVLTGSNYTLTGSSVTASVGTWVCVVPVPAYGVSSSAQNQMRQAGVNYFPTSPEPANLANPWDTGGGAVGRYWEQLGTDAGEEISSYKGEYNSYATYNYGDEVTVSSGSSQGLTWINVATSSTTGIAPVWPLPSMNTPPSSSMWILTAPPISGQTICNQGNSTVAYYAGIFP